jgi:hypothetical protein
VRSRSRVLSAAMSAITAVVLSVGGAPAAQAAVEVPPVVEFVAPLVPGAGSVLSYIKYADTAYNLFLQFATKQPKPVSDLQKIQIAIAASTQAINEHSDALANAEVSGCIDDAAIALEGITGKSPDAKMAAAADAVQCVTKAKNLIAVEGLAGVDTLGFALNTVGPMALFMQSYVGQPTGLLQQTIIAGNQQLIARLQPTCGVTPYATPAAIHEQIRGTGGWTPGDWDHIRVAGHGACYNYAAPPPTTSTYGTVVFATGPGTGADPWEVIGDGVPRICSGIFLCGSHVNWPSISDHSIAIDQAMANTSYPVAGAALHRLLPGVAAAGAPVAMATTVNDRTGAHVIAFGVSPDGKVFMNPLTVGLTAPQWTEFPGAPKLRSLAAATNADGSIEVFGIDRVGGIHHSWQMGGEFGSWSPWAKMDGQLSSIAVARNANGALQVFGTTPAGTIFTRNQILNGDYHPAWTPRNPVPATNKWSNWKQMSGTLDSISASADISGRIELFGTKAGSPYQNEQTAANATDPSTNWSGWNSLHRPFTETRSMAVTLDPLCRLQFFSSSGSAVYQSQRHPDRSWGFNWAAIPPGNNITGVAAARAGAYSIVLGVSPNGIAFANVAQNGSIGNWLGWAPLGGATIRTFN